eukprot:2640030-Pyramimonas_sp.AAC.1
MTATTTAGTKLRPRGVRLTDPIDESSTAMWRISFKTSSNALRALMLSIVLNHVPSIPAPFVV